MIRSIRRAVTLGAVALGAALAAQGASATVLSFTGDAQTATAGNALTVNATDGSGLSVSVYGAQFNSSGTSYSGATAETWTNYGLGVLGSGESTNNGSHQIDNNGVVDFVVLKFSQAVTLADINRTNYDYLYTNQHINPVTGTGTDASFMAYNGGGVTESSDWTSLWGSASNTNSKASSNIWLVAANVGQTDDAFKISSLVVSLPNCVGSVPEPASWAMMLVGFGAIGASLRRRNKDAFVAA